MTSTVTTTWSNSCSSSRKMTLVRTIKRNLTFPLDFCPNSIPIWPGKTQISRRKSISCLSLSITPLITRKTAIFGYWSRQDLIEVEELRFLIRLNNWKRYWLIIWSCLTEKRLMIRCLKNRKGLKNKRTNILSKATREYRDKKIDKLPPLFPNNFRNSPLRSSPPIYPVILDNLSLSLKNLS